MIARAYPIEPATLADIESMRRVEERANQLFDAIGYGFCVEIGPSDIEEHELVLRVGATLVARAGRAVVAFAMFLPIDGEWHLDEIDVDPHHQRQGLARRLIDEGGLIGRARGHQAMTLTTFRDVAWQRPVYEKLGFEPFDPDADRVELFALLEKEKAWRLAQKPRLVMRKRLV